jgi:hypothetical protein
MKIELTKKFSKLGSGNNWAGFGKENYIKLESGESLEVNNVDESLVEGGYVKEVTTSKKSTKKESK